MKPHKARCAKKRSQSNHNKLLQKWIPLTKAIKHKRKLLQKPSNALLSLAETFDNDLLNLLTNTEKEYFVLQNASYRKDILNSFKQWQNQRQDNAPLRIRVLCSKLPIHMKNQILNKIKKYNEGHENVKFLTWVEHLLAHPIDKFVDPPIKCDDCLVDEINKARQTLDKVVFGHDDAKKAILQRLYQWIIAPESTIRPLAFHGVPGNGKSSLARYGAAAVFKRPFAFIGCGGATDASFLVGHSYTYEGSVPGRIANALSKAGCLNPLMYFDEIDKCSTTAKGDEIVNTLIQLTDPVQSDVFKDSI